MLLLLLSLTDESQRDQVELIYYKYEKDLGIFARNKLKMLGINDRNAADDIVQNSFVKIIKMYDRIDFTRPERELRSLFFTIVDHEAYDYAQRIPPVCTELNENIADMDDEDLLNYVFTKDETEKILKALGTLDEIYRTPLELRFLQDMDVKTISEITGVPVQSVYHRIKVGKNQILKCIGKDVKI